MHDTEQFPVLGVVLGIRTDLLKEVIGGKPLDRTQNVVWASAKGIGNNIGVTRTVDNV